MNQERRNAGIRIGFISRLLAPWGVWGLSLSKFRLPRVLQPRCRAGIGQIFGSRIAALAVNERGVAAANGQEVVYGTATNIAPIDINTEDDWICVSPYGEHRNEKGLQVFDRVVANEMASFHNSWVGKSVRFLRGDVPVFKGHPPPDTERWGRVNRLDARDDGLYGEVAWNDLGIRNKEQGYYRYPSPAWTYKKLEGGRIRPLILDHIGLTNRPNIFESVPVTNSKSSADPAESEQTTTKENMNKEALIKALGLAADATDDQIITAINALVDEKKTLATNVQTATTAQQTAETALNAANEELKKFKKLAINAYLAGKLEKGVITAAEMPQWATNLEIDFEKFQAELENKGPALNTKSLGLSPSGKDLSDASKRRQVFNVRIDHHLGHGCKSIDEAINAMRADTEDAALLEAMQKAEEDKAAA